MDIGNASVNYSHQYEALLRKHGFFVYRGGWRVNESRPRIRFYDAVVKKRNGGA